MVRKELLRKPLNIALISAMMLAGCGSVQNAPADSGTGTSITETAASAETEADSEDQTQYAVKTWNFTEDSIGVRYTMPENSLQRRNARAVYIPGTAGEAWLMAGYLTKDTMGDLQINLDGKTEEEVFLGLKEAFMGTVYDTLHDSGDTEDTEITVASQERVRAGKFDFIKTVGTMAYNGGKLGGDPWEHRFICYTTRLPHYGDAPVWIMVMDCSDDQGQSEAELDACARTVCESVREITNDTLDPEVIE